MASVNSINRLQQLERLAELSRGIGNKTDLETLIYSMTELACDLTECAVALVILYEPETDLLKFIAGPVNQREALKNIRIPVEKSLEGLVYRQAKSVILNDCQSDSRYVPRVEKELKIQVHNLLAVPLLFRGETIGVFEGLNKKGGGGFTQDDLMIFETLSSQAAIAILSHLLFDEVQHAYQEVDELERMKSNFIAITSHELRTPIGLILGHASFLNETNMDPLTRQQLEVIIRNAERLKTITEDLSNVNEAQNGPGHLRFKLISLNSLIQKVLETLMPLARSKEISVLVKAPEKDLMIDADGEKIFIAINNLLNNAITFSDSGGHILVTAEQISSYVQVSITDDGIGIPVKDLPHVFDRFFQVQSHLTRKHGGMGLGLSVAKAMIELHKGQIWVESIEGKGSRFSFILPSVIKQTPNKVSAFIP